MADEGSPVYTLNNWFLTNPTIADLLNYTGGVKPFIPVQQQPENQGNFVTYTVRYYNEAFFGVRVAEIAYAVYAFKYTEAQRIENEMVAMCEHDFSGPRLEDYADLTDYVYHDVEFVQSIDLNPPEQEAGRFGRLLTFRLRYTPTFASPVGP